MIKLIVKASVKDGDSKEYTYVFDQPVIAIGRLKENDIQLPLSTISGYHSQILKEDDTYYLMDRNSINGTYLNGVRLGPDEKKLLQDNDTIRIQTFEIFFTSSATVVNSDQGATVQVARQMVMEMLGSLESHNQEKPSVIVMGGPNNGKQLELSEAKPLQLGRSPESDIMIDHPSISRRHASISYTWSGSFIKDLNSSNGVFINDQRINGSLKLHDRDEIRLGQASSSSPIILIFNNPAEALLSKIEQQSTEMASSEKIAQEAGVPSAEKAVQSGEPVDAGAPIPQQTALPKPSREPASVSAASVPVEKAVAPVKSRNIWIAIGAVVILSAIGAAIALYRPEPVKSGKVEFIEPDRGPGGQIVKLSGNRLNSEEVESVTIKGQNAIILSRDVHQLEIKIPDYPNLNALETKADIIIEGQDGSLGQFPFTILQPLQVKTVLPPYGPPGTEVRVQTNAGGKEAKVFFGAYPGNVQSATDTEIVVSVPSPNETVPSAGLKLPVTVRSGEIISKNNVPFTVMPVESEVFQLAFSAKPYSTVLGFNEYSVDTNLGPLLVVVARDQYGSSQERAERTAAALNNAIEFFSQNPSATLAMQKEGGNFALYAKDGQDGSRLLLRVFPEDAMAYSKITRHVVDLQDLANWWQMLLGSYFKVFVQIQSPADTGILSVGGAIFQQIYNFYPVSNNQGQKYFRKDFLSTLPLEQKEKLSSLSLALPQKVSGVGGKWNGTMANVLYPAISAKDIDLTLNIRQTDYGALSGSAEMNWKFVMGSTEGDFKNVAFKKLGTFSLQGRYDRTKTYPVEFTIVEKDGRRLNFVGRIDGDILSGRFVVSSTGEEGTWSSRQE
jgi:pSer/pThr/pTyr-binding forkhead associated (FHA) protein